MAERNAAVEPDRRMQFRIGINIGDIIVDEAHIYGDGINIAARLESIAEPGGILISRQAYDQVDGKLKLRFQKLGPRNLKNIARPIEVVAIDIRQAGRAEREGGMPAASPREMDAPRAITAVAARPSPSLRSFAAYALAPVIVLVLAHYVMVMKLDLNPAYLRGFSLLFSTGVGFVLSRRTGNGLGAACLVGAVAGILSVWGMLAIVGFADSTAIIPSSLFEWQEALNTPSGLRSRPCSATCSPVPAIWRSPPSAAIDQAEGFAISAPPSLQMWSSPAVPRCP
jgi:hypothetical protein